MAESAAYAVRTFLGGAALARIPAGLNAGALSATADDLSTWIGAVAAGNTRAMLDRVGSNPEEVEISGISGNDITFSARGLEGTDDATHDPNVTIELIMSPRDLREANKWANELSGAATAANVALAADGANSLTGITVAASRIMARLAAGDYKACTPDEIATLLALDTGDISGLAEFIADTVGAMFTGNTETGITATYQDADNTIDLEVSGGASSFSGVVASRSTTQAITTATETAVQCDAADDVDTESVHDPVTNNTRITIPAAWNGKKVRLFGQVTFAGNATGRRIAFFKKNGGATYMSEAEGNTAGTLDLSVPVEYLIVSAVTGDYYELCVYHTKGSDLNLQGNSQGPQYTKFTATLMGA